MQNIMKISLKLLLSTIVVMALALGLSGFYFVNYVFETSLNREVGQASDESSILSFAFETAVLNVPARYKVLPDSTVDEIASNGFCSRYSQIQNPIALFIQQMAIMSILVRRLMHWEGFYISRQ